MLDWTSSYTVRHVELLDTRGGRVSSHPCLDHEHCYDVEGLSISIKWDHVGLTYWTTTSPPKHFLGINCSARWPRNYSSSSRLKWLDIHVVRSASGSNKMDVSWCTSLIDRSVTCAGFMSLHEVMRTCMEVMFVRRPSLPWMIRGHYQAVSSITRDKVERKRFDHIQTCLFNCYQALI